MIDVTIDTSPSKNLYMNITAINYKTNTYTNDISFYPITIKATSSLQTNNASIQISKSKYVESWKVSLIDNKPFANSGVYTLSVTLQGPSADEYQVIYSRNNTIAISSAPTIPLTASTITSARFSSNALKLLVNFDSPTDGGRVDTYIFVCSKLFTFLGNDNTTCHWENNDNTTVIVEDLSDNSIVPGMILSIKNDVNIYAQCPISCKCSSPRSPSTSVVVLEPLLLESPSLSISAPSVLGDCQDYRLDFTGCSGSGNRKWRVFNINITTTSSNTTKFNMLKDLTNSMTTYQQLILINHDYFDADSSYTFYIYMCTFLLACDTITTNVHVYDDYRPYAQILGESNRVVNRKEQVVFFSDAYLPSCSSRLLRTGFTYSWTVSSGGIELIDNRLVSSSSSLSISPGTFESNKVYDISLKVVASRSGRAVTNAIRVSAISTVTANIKGGSVYAMYPSSSLVLDASSNLDHLEKDETLSFTWSCMRTSPSFGICNGITIGSLKSGKKNTPSMLSVTTKNYTMCEPGEVIITLVVSSSLSFDTATNEIYISILSSNTPIIESLTNTNTNSNSKVKVNTNEKLLIEGTVGIPTNATITWSSSSSSIDLKTASLTPISMFMYSTKATTISILLRPYSLPEGSRFSITLSCVTNNKNVSSSITIVTNNPPKYGNFIVNPKSGIELKVIIIIIITVSYTHLTLPTNREV